LAAALALSLLGLLVPQVASATIKCRYKPAKHFLSVTANDRGLEWEAVVRRVGVKIRVLKEFGGRVNCHGSPTVTNTDHVRVITRGILAEATISLAGGPFAPGATPESDLSPEIEFTIGGTGEVDLLGGRKADHFRYMSAAGQTGLNLNPGPGDEDIDLLLAPSQIAFVANGGPGPDTIDARAHPRVFMLAEGGGGNDTLDDRGSGLGFSLLEGNAGRDRIFGGSGGDLILPGAGADLVDAGSGHDTVFARPDKEKDRIDCGRSHDSLRRFGPPHPGATADRFDRLSSCERVEGRRR
jgi:Ca2+-binding RTX toxin-like protein